MHVADSASRIHRISTELEFTEHEGQQDVAPLISRIDALHAEIIESEQSTITLLAVARLAVIEATEDEAVGH